MVGGFSLGLAFSIILVFIVLTITALFLGLQKYKNEIRVYSILAVMLLAIAIGIVVLSSEQTNDVNSPHVPLTPKKEGVPGR